MITAQDVYEEARTWVGTRWHHQGRTHAGIDCVGLLVVVARSLGIPLTDYLGYRTQPDSKVLMSHLQSNFVAASNGDRKPGRIAVLRDSRFPLHVGILSWHRGAVHLIHARAERRSVIEEPLLEVPHGLHAIHSLIEFPGVAPWQD